MDILFKDNQVIIPLPKAVLVLSREAFIQALRQGKAYRRREAMAQRRTPIERHKHVSCDRHPLERGGRRAYE